jgi:hypothetical protein
MRRRKQPGLAAQPVQSESTSPDEPVEEPSVDAQGEVSKAVPKPRVTRRRSPRTQQKAAEPLAVNVAIDLSPEEPAVPTLSIPEATAQTASVEPLTAEVSELAHSNQVDTPEEAAATELPEAPEIDNSAEVVAGPFPEQPESPTTVPEFHAIVDPARAVDEAGLSPTVEKPQIAAEKIPEPSIARRTIPDHKKMPSPAIQPKMNKNDDVSNRSVVKRVATHAVVKPETTHALESVSDKPIASTTPVLPEKPIGSIRPTAPFTPIRRIVPIFPIFPIVKYSLPRLSVLRQDDLLSVSVDFVNLSLDTSKLSTPKLVIQNGAATAYLIFTFPPQSLLEEAYFEESTTIKSVPSFNPTEPPLSSNPDTLAAPGNVPAYLSGSSRLVFKVPSKVKEIAYSVEGLLDWTHLDLVVSPFALGKPLPAPITPPTVLETAIELPWRVILSPGNGVAFNHSVTPESYAGRTALWVTRLGKNKKVTTESKTTTEVIEASTSSTVPLRAIWSQDFTDHGPIPQLDNEVPWRAPLDPHDRMQIVIQTSGTLGYSNGTSRIPEPFSPKAIQASRLFLSTLGGYLSSRGSWNQLATYTDTAGITQECDLTEWDHLATLGRDHYVKVVYAGYLYPFGNAASLVKVTERKVVPQGGAVTQPTAYLMQHMYIVVRQPEMNYDSPDTPFQYGMREMPFWQSVRIKTVVTPDIDVPVMITGDGKQHNSFWISVGGENLNFHLVAKDLNGNNIDFLAPLIFMSLDESYPSGVQSIYADNDDERVCTVKGQKIAYADPSTGDTLLRTTELYFTTELLITAPPYPTTPFVPILDYANVTVPAIEQILGTSNPLLISYYPPYLQSGFDAFAGVYAAISPSTTPTPQIAFSAQQSGGFSTPTITLTALSARKGLIAGSAADAAIGMVNPSQFFDAAAQLFGVIPLQSLIPVNSAGLATATLNAPEIRTKDTPNSKNPTSLVTTIQWNPQLQDYSVDPVQITFNQNGLVSALSLKATLTRDLTGGPPSSDISGQLTNFQINLLGVVALVFNSLKFNSKSGQKLMVNASLPSTNAIQFIGPLSFVQTLANILPPGIFGGQGPSVDLEPTEIEVSYCLGLPPVSIGVFSLENISITTGLDLPYLNGEPEFEFAFAKRSSPFLITVECLGGGGFIHLVVSAAGVQMVEGQLEFGGEFSLDLGVASGSVHAMAGIYFKLTGTSTDLTGFVDIGGEVSVLGIISISLDLNLSLSYMSSNGQSKIQGRATMTVSVSVLFFSASVSISVERSFGSEPGDPRIKDVITANDWSEYAAAFA